MEHGAERMRVGELARRVGVSAHVLRAWETRYGMFSPERSESGYRLYGPTDEQVARQVITLRDSGMPLAQAAATVLARHTDGPVITPSATQEYTSRLGYAMLQLDNRGARMVLDEAITQFGLEQVIRGVIVPFMQELGGMWANGDVSVAHEHFASHAVRRTLAVQTVDQTEPGSPIALLACPPGERHDIGLLCMAILMSRRGWDVRFLGADTPLHSLVRVADTVRPDLVVLSASRRSAFESRRGIIRRLSSSVTIAIGGGGSGPALAADLNARLLPPDLIDAAEATLEFASESTELVAR
ncbi:MerR family transcriptional regulator [Yimella sp. cx-51]|uniref:MerR family transcriptional regulator n=1 Tax=Yimella sp. cx-51 TaxID=2770551 RepID=UPI00165E7660|nr:MerR family transcriptional regulator [Yimella sp. cx-51]MBD2760581.1 MerR family transcriptional regulator [Yimella sp. cx-573]QTH38175.1 MerR family transcriptional regulator [Yimella sp. cx-51]